MTHEEQIERAMNVLSRVSREAKQIVRALTGSAEDDAVSPVDAETEAAVEALKREGASPAPGNRAAVPFADSELEHTCPRPGEIRAAGPIEEHSSQPHRLVCVLEIDARYGFATVALATNEIDLATPEDVVVRRDRTGASFDLLLELGIVAPLWWAQLGPPLGKVRLDEVENDPELRTTMPLRWEEDIRWTFKESELRDLQALAANCARTVIDHADTAIVDLPYLDSVVIKVKARDQ